jgi:hypothetical protein
VVGLWGMLYLSSTVIAGRLVVPPRVPISDSIYHRERPASK